MRRLYFLVPTVDSATQIVDELLEYLRYAPGVTGP